MLVIGTSSGIGRATALALAKHQERVVLVARRQSILDELATRCGPLASAYACDITDDGKIKQLVAKLKADFAQIDILVHSAGVIKIGNTEDSSVTDFDAQLAAMSEVLIS